jgi:UTP--glucose-1-phosphate uridylyltransferase
MLQLEGMRALDKQSGGAGGEAQLTRTMAHMIRQQPCHAVTFGRKRYDFSSKVGFVEVTLAVDLQLEDIADKMRTLIKRIM